MAKRRLSYEELKERVDELEDENQARFETRRKTEPAKTPVLCAGREDRLDHGHRVQR